MGKFPMKDLNPVNFYLDIKVDRDRAKRTIRLTQTTAIDRIIKNIGMKDYKITKILIESEL